MVTQFGWIITIFINIPCKYRVRHFLVVLHYLLTILSGIGKNCREIFNFLIFLENSTWRIIICPQAIVPPNEIARQWSKRENQVHLTAGHCSVGRLPV